MAKKTQKKKPAKKRSIMEILGIPRNHEERLLALIKASERCITPHNSALDQFFTQQASRIKEELKEYKKNK